MQKFTSVETFNITGRGVIHTIEFEKPLYRYEIDLYHQFIELDGEIVKVTQVGCFTHRKNKSVGVIVRPPTPEEWMTDQELFETACKEIEDIAQNYEDYSGRQEEVDKEVQL